MSWVVCGVNNYFKFFTLFSILLVFLNCAEKKSDKEIYFEWRCNIARKNVYLCTGQIIEEIGGCEYWIEKLWFEDDCNEVRKILSR